MSLHDDIDIYLAQRRARGFKLNTTEYLLRQFCSWLQARGKTETFTIDDAVQWACDPPGAAPVWRSQRLTAVRPFAAWLNARDGVVPVIPAALLPVRTTRRDPFIYSQTGLRVPPLAGHMVMRPAGRGWGGSECTGFPTRQD